MGATAGSDPREGVTTGPHAPLQLAPGGPTMAPHLAFLLQDLSAPSPVEPPPPGRLLYLRGSQRDRAQLSTAGGFHWFLGGSVAFSPGF